MQFTDEQLTTLSQFLDSVQLPDVVATINVSIHDYFASLVPVAAETPVVAAPVEALVDAPAPADQAPEVVPTEVHVTDGEEVKIIVD